MTVAHTVVEGRVRRDLALATAALATYNYASLGTFALMPFIRLTLHLSPLRIGLLASTQFLVAGALAFPAARAVDRFAPGRVVCMSQLFVVLAMAVAAVASSLLTFLVASTLLGIASAVVNPVTNVLSSAQVPVRRRALAMSAKQSGVTVAGVIAGVTLPVTAGATSWRLALALPALVALLVAAWAAGLREAPSGERLILSDVKRPVPRVNLGMFGFAMSGVQLAVFGYIAVYLVVARGVTPRIAGDEFAVVLAAGGVGRLSWGYLADRLGARGVLLVAVALGSGGALLLLPAVGPVGLWPVLVLLGLCSVGWNGVFHTVVAESAGPHGVARATAFAFIFLYAGSVVLPPALGYAAQVSSWHAFWWIAAVAAVVGALILGPAVRRSRATAI